jgi:hypothetical protein
MTYWFSRHAPPDHRRRQGQHGLHVTAYLGFYNSFGTGTEQPYPIVVAGMCPQKETRFNSNRESVSFFANPCTRNFSTVNSTHVSGPVLTRFVDGQWLQFVNRVESFSNSATSSAENNPRVVTPMNWLRMQTVSNEDDWDTGSWGWDTFVPITGLTPTYELHPTPSTPSNLVPIWPIGFQMQTPSKQILGELDGVFWVSVFGSGLVSEDSIEIGGEQYRLFQNGFRTESYQYIAVKEA